MNPETSLGDAGPMGPLCPRYHRAVELLGRRWAGAILHRLLDGPLRFNELLGAIPGISDRLLTLRLRELEAAGIVRRPWSAQVPNRTPYALTECGRDLAPALAEIARWAEQWIPLPEEA